VSPGRREVPGTSRLSPAAGPIRLDRRTGDIAVGAEDAAISRLRSEPGAAVGAVVEVLTGVKGHLFQRAMPAVRTGQCRFKDHLVSHDRHGKTRAG
jgi:hypothetical protein